MELVEPVRDAGVVVEEAGPARLTVADAADEPPLRRHRADQELAERARLVDPVGPLEPPARLGQGGQREAVPGGDRLVVETRLRAAGSDLEQPCARGRVEGAPQDEAAVLERLEQLLGRSFAG